ncbi:MAG: adenosine deaminase [Candidatus Bathyarchaeia archaeon]|jgi:adenosine deaminase
MKGKDSMELFIKGIPKAELHLHIEGTLEPEMLFKMAKRNSVRIKYRTVEEVKAAYNFRNLQDFLNVYYEGTSVLRNEQDFYDLTWAYLEKACSQNVLHTEIFFDPQAHTRRGIKFDTVITGVRRALRDGEQKLGISTRLIMCILRDLNVESAFQTLEEALSYKDWITAIGLNSAEVGHPPSKFQKVFEKALENGFLTVAHAGEEGPAEYIWEAIRLLKVSRIDHGNRAVEDENLLRELARKGIPLTMCPISNLKLGVIKNMEGHPLKKIMEMGIVVTVNSDDPAYFGGYINENYLAVQKALGLNAHQICTLARNSFQASFLSRSEKHDMLMKLEKYAKEYAT